MNDPQVVLCEVTDPFGHVESEPLVVSVDEAGTLRLELVDGTVMRCRWVEVAQAAEGRRAA